MCTLNATPYLDISRTMGLVTANTSETNNVSKSVSSSAKNLLDTEVNFDEQDVQENSWACNNLGMGVGRV